MMKDNNSQMEENKGKKVELNRLKKVLKESREQCKVVESLIKSTRL